ncbi:EF-hand domain-containing protein [Pseudomonas sp. Marseille-P9899]|uniref:EF-hand domain-containing protein n=1 Tax=Pseudomonas sp. Marseille-P9899 TaxID=2730401 RepID=UPI001589E84C
MANTKPTVAQAQAVLDTMDINKDGFVSRAEFVERMLEQGFKETTLNQLLDEIDTDEDGTISAEEYLRRL